MNLVPTFSWLTSLRRARARRAAPFDFADMGTAFGLDASLDSVPPVEPALIIKKGRTETGAPLQRSPRVGLRGSR